MALDILTPIPDLEQMRTIKDRYRAFPIDMLAPGFREPLVPISDYGLAGVSYYSQPNNATGDPVPGVSPEIYVRKRVAEKLAVVDDFLRTDSVAATSLGCPTRLYIKEGFRSPLLQAYLYEDIFPNLLRQQHPEWTDDQIRQRVNETSAHPEWSESSMPPHMTGGAVDVILVSAESGEILNTGFRSAHLGGEAIHTDYLEQVSDNELAIAGLEQAVITRRVLYNVLTSSAHEVGGIAMANNPVETWHYSYGDQMWALLRNQPAAIYGIPPGSPSVFTDM